MCYVHRTDVCYMTTSKFCLGQNLDCGGWCEYIDSVSGWIMRYDVDHSNSDIMLVIESSKVQDNPSPDLLPPPTASPTGPGARSGVAQRQQQLQP